MAFASKQVAFGKTATRSVKAVRGSAARAATRELWLPGADVPSHLKGTLPGDFGFDPLNLGADPESLRWYVHAEVYHCRTAMAGAAGIVIPGLLTKAGILNTPEWYEAGAVYAKSEGAIPTPTLLVMTAIFYHWAESKRYGEFKKAGSQAEKGTFFGLESFFAGTGEDAYPGFDPAGLSKNAASFLDYKKKEIANGRLAMLAHVGFVAQYAATGKGPIDNLFDHLADPTHATFAENGVSIPQLKLLGL